MTSMKRIDLTGSALRREARLGLSALALLVIVLVGMALWSTLAAAVSATGPLTGFTLVDASDQTKLATLTDGVTVELDDPANGSYAIRADVGSDSDIGSVYLELSGAKSVSRTEGVAPYSLYGDGGANALTGGTLPVGSYDLEATAYSAGNKGGDELGTFSVSFTGTAPDPADLVSTTLFAPNSPATGTPVISGRVRVGQTLTADTSGITDEDGLTNVSYGYLWIRGDGTDDTDIAGETASTYTLVPADQDKTIKVEVSFTDDDNNQETLTSAATGTVAAATVPLTVSLENKPTSHDGSDDFSFDVRFSEEFDLSYETLKLHAFNVSGGSVQKAQRLQKEAESNTGWKITVRPGGNGDVTVELPITTGCSTTGTICTGDGRMLSNGLEFTVSGPGG